MNTADQVDVLTESLVEQVKRGAIPLSDAAFEAAKACVGWAYVYSAWGALCTPSERRKRYGMTGIESIKTKCENFNGTGTCSGCKWYPGGKRTRCYDCRGFTKWTLEQFGIVIRGDTCGAQWNNKENWIAKGTIDTIPDNVLVCVFIHNGTKWTHTGLAYKGQTCECSAGVQYFEKRKAGRWTHWALPKGVTDKMPDTDSRPTLRKGSKGDLVTDLQNRLMQLGFALPKFGADGDYGGETIAAVKAFQAANGLQADGVCGTMTWKKLLDASGERYMVTIPDVPKAAAEALVKQYPGATMTKEGGD